MIYLPQNIFSSAITNNLPDELKNEIKFSPSALLSKDIAVNNENVGLIPTTDLINYKDFFISKKFGLSFEGSLCNSYIYFKQQEKTLSDLNILGDASSLEVIIGKILFKEMYSSDVKVKLIADGSNDLNKNFIAIGNKNFENDLYKTGISFAEEIVDFLSLPFVNYILVSNSEEKLKKVESDLILSSEKIYDTFENLFELNDFNEETKTYILSNISSLTVLLEEQDVEGIQSLLQLPYYHGVIEEMIEINFLK